jgi:hypothetical protein
MATTAEMVAKIGVRVVTSRMVFSREANSKTRAASCPASFFPLLLALLAGWPPTCFVRPRVGK